LETTDKSLVGDVRKIVWKGDRIYIQDGTSQRVQIFSTDSKHIGTLSREGRGPGEYVRISDFFVDGSAIHVISADSRKIIRYDLDNFFNHAEYGIPESTLKLAVVGDRVWFGDTFTYDGLIELASFENGEIVDPFFVIREEFDGTVGSNPTQLKTQSFFGSDDALLFNQRFTGDVYELDADDPELLLRVSSRLPASADLRDGNTFHGFEFVYRAGDIIFGRLWGANENYPSLFTMNLKTGVASLGGLRDLGLPTLSTSTTSSQGKFMTVMSAHNITDKRDGSGHSADMSIIEKFIDIEKVEEGDNPILVIFSLVEKENRAE